MKLLSLSLIGLMTATFGSMAFAGSQSQSQNGQAQTPAQTQGQALSFDQLRSACLNPAQFHNQIAPTNIQVTCADTQTKWVPDPDGTMNMSTQRDVTATVQSDKYSASTTSGGVPMAQQTAACPKFKQVTESVQTVQNMTCADLTAYTGSAVDYCTDAINTLRGANPAAITQVETGRTIDLCGQGAGQRAGQNTGN